MSTYITESKLNVNNLKSVCFSLVSVLRSLNNTLEDLAFKHHSLFKWGWEFGDNALATSTYQ